MSDEVENPTTPVAPEVSETQPEQAAPADESANAPSVPEEKEELILGKFKNQDDLVRSYQELEQKTTKTAQENAEVRRMLGEMNSQVPEMANAPEVPQLDPDSAAAVKAMLRQELQSEFETRKANEFARKHADELKDRLLRATVQDIMSEARANQVYKDQEEALAEAKSLLSERIKPIQKEAQIEGVKQGEDLAQKKGEMGAIGESGPRPKVNPDDLSAEDYAKTLNIPRGR